MKFNKNLLGYGLAFVGGGIIGAVVGGVYALIALAPIILSETIQLCPSCEKDFRSGSTTLSPKCKDCIDRVIKYKMGFGDF